MGSVAETALAPCREITDNEVADYLRDGWVKLEGFVRPETTALLLEIAYQRMGEDGDSNAPYGLNQPFFNAEFGDGLSQPEVRALIGGIGRASRRLMNRRGNVGVRYFTDFFAPKLPSAKETRNAGNGPTDFHQDFMTFGVDRTGGMTFWISLEDYGPEFGTMSFINGSHRLGVLGGYHKGDLRSFYPELLDLKMSEPTTYKAGDITVHSHLTVHGAGRNVTDRPRWPYVVLTQPADVCYNGGYTEAFDPTGMERDQPLPDDRFPIIG
jgi:hypothetical protein